MKKSLYLSFLLIVIYSCKSTFFKHEKNEENISKLSKTTSKTKPSLLSSSPKEWPSNSEQKLYRASKTILSDLIHTKLEITFNWKKAALIGKATITAKPHFYKTNELILDAKGMEIKLVKRDGLPLKYTYDGNKLKINLAKTFNKNQKYTIEIDYISKPNERETSGGAAIMSDKGLYFINNNGKEPNKMPQIWTQGETESNSVWFPTIDSPNAKSSQEIFITVDKKFKTLSNGKLIYQKLLNNGKRLDYWKQEKPHAPYLFMLAVGEFVEIQDYYIRPDGSKMRVNYFVEKEFAPYAKDIFGETPKMISFFSELLGVPYPWDKYDQVVVRDFVSGAMENTGAVIFGDFVYKTDKELLDGNDQSIIAHELFHHWFGDLVTCESWANLSLNESFANYSQYLWDEHRYGKDEADFYADEEAKAYFNSARYQGYHDLIWFSYLDKDDMFDNHSYNKGGRILHMLRAYVGDSAFFKSLNLYLTRNAFKAAEFTHLRLAFEEVTGEDLNWFFNQWYMDKGHPVLEIHQSINKDKSTITLKTVQQQKTEYPVFKLPVEVVIYDEMGKRTEKILIDKRIQTFTFSYTGKLKNILFDKNKVLLGHFYHDKPNESYIHQYYHGKSYKARRKGLLIGSRQNSIFSNKMILDALNDPFWGIREEAILLLEKLPIKDKNEISIKLKDISLNDPKSLVRKTAIEALSEYVEANEMIAICNQIIDKDSSYLVVIKALEKTTSLDSIKGLDKAIKLEKGKSKKLLIGIAEIYSKYGSKEKLRFFQSCILNGSLSGGYSELEMINFLMDFVIKKDLFDKEELLEIFTYLNKNASSYTKKYMPQLLNYVTYYIEDKVFGLLEELKKEENPIKAQKLNKLEFLLKKYKKLSLK